MLRALVAVLVLVNLLLFAWFRGAFAPTWPPPRHGEREPERLAAQVRPEVLVVLPASAASAALRAAREAARVCLEAGPLTDADVAAAESALAPAALPEGSWKRESVTPNTWLVFAGRYPEGAQRRARQDELKKLGLSFELIRAPEELAPGLVLSRHDKRDAAEAALATVSATPLKGAQVVALPASAAQLWLRVPRAETDLATRLKALPGEPLAGGFKPCTAQP